MLRQTSLVLAGAGLVVSAACGDPPATTPEPPPLVATSQLIVQLSGLPRNAAVPAQADTLRRAGFGVRIVGPNGVDTTLLTSTTLNALRPGSYAIAATGATLDSVGYAATPESATVVLADNASSVASVSFAATTGGVDVRVSGVLDGSAPRAVLRYPDGQLDSVTLPVRRLLLTPGRYLLTAAPFELSGVLYQPATMTDTVMVSPTAAPAVRTVSYQSQLATLAVAVSGAPASDRLGFVSLVAPDGGVRLLRANMDTVRFTGLLSGQYLLRATAFDVLRARYAPVQAEDTIAIAAGEAAMATLSYTRATAALRIAVSGVPNGLTASVRVTGPEGFDSTVTPPARLDNLRPANYTLVANSLVGELGAGTRTVRTIPASRSVPVAFGDTTLAEFPYAITTGGLAVTVSGLPDSLQPALRILREVGAPEPGFPWLVNSTSDVRHNISPGRYTLTATAIVSGGSVFIPSPVQREVTVQAAATTDSVAVRYTKTEGPLLDFAITGAYITQATQRSNGSVPLVANREALLRVFVQANEGNAERLTVRVRLLQDTIVYNTFTIPSPGTSAPLTVNEGTLTQSWNVPLSQNDVREGMRFIADFGATPGVSDANAGNNRWPATGVQEVDVRGVSPFSLVLVPVQHPVDSLTGAVSAANASSFTALTRALLPLEHVSVSVHAPFSTSAPALVDNDVNNGWSTVLNEMNALRLMESAGNAYYMGIVGTTYDRGIAGIASIGGRNAVSWDRPPSAARIVAHELGHNFGRFHSPGCGTGFVDANYPHGGGAIGVWGWNGSVLLSPTTTNDIMGYCSTQWVSDYTWIGVLNFRAINSAVVPRWLGPARTATTTATTTATRAAARTATRAAARTATQAATRAAAQAATRAAARPPTDSVLVVWGAVYGDSARLEPAVRAAAAVEWPPVGSGRYTLELLDAQDRVLRTVRFDGDQLDHRADVRTFAFALPVPGSGAEPVTMRLRRGGALLAEQRARSVRRSGSTGTVPPAGAAQARAALLPALLRRSAAITALEWDNETWPLAIVRDARSGEVVAITRRSGERLALGARRAVVVTLSDGLRTMTQQLAVP